MSEQQEGPKTTTEPDDGAADATAAVTAAAAAAEHGTVGTTTRTKHMRAVAPRQSGALTALIVAITVIVTVIDQATKFIAEARLVEGEETRWFIGELVGWKLLYNPGAALSIGTGMTWVLTLVALGVVIFIVRVARRIDSIGWTIAFGLLLGGAIGNLIDRFFKDPGFARGHVVDFINYAGFFVGNVADIAIVVAAVMIAWLAIKGTAISLPGAAAESGDEAADDSAGLVDDTDEPGDDSTELVDDSAESVDGLAERADDPAERDDTRDAPGTPGPPGKPGKPGTADTPDTSDAPAEPEQGI